MTKSKRVKLTTPFGRAGFCALIRPSVKFNPDGDYNAKVVLPDGPETDALIATLDALYEKAYKDNLAEARIEKPKLVDIKRADKPFRRPIDEDTGEALPGWVLNSRLTAIYRDKQGRITSESKPVTVDSQNNPVTHDVGAGSTIRVQFLASGFYVPALGSGLSLKLVGVQVKDLVPLGSAKAEFDALPDGFVETAKAHDPVEVMHAPADSLAPPDSAVAVAGDENVDW